LTSRECEAKRGAIVGLAARSHVSRLDARILLSRSDCILCSAIVGHEGSFPKIRQRANEAEICVKEIAKKLCKPAWIKGAAGQQR